jgi:two-component system, sensor histidine kinase
MTFLDFLRKLKYSGAGDLPEYDVKRGVCIGVNIMCIAIFFLNLVSGLLFYCLSGNLSVIIGAYFEALLVLGIIAINKRHLFELANVSFYTIIIAATFYFSAILGKGSETQLMILFILGLTFFIFEKVRTRVFAILVALALLVLLEVNDDVLFIEPAVMTPQVALFVRWLVYAVVISLVLLIFYLYQKNTGLLIRLHTYSKNIKASLLSEERQNELKNLFFQNMSHDIKGCYFGVGSLCATIHEKLESHQEISTETADLLISLSEHYKFLLNSFLEFSKFKNAAFENIALEAFDVKKEIERIVEIYRYVALQKNIRIEIIASFGFPNPILGDRLKVTRILVNLLSNAIKFSRPNTCVFIRISHGSDHWRLVVQDEGKGMRPEVLDNMFKPYITEISEHNPEGIGLGLHITRYLTDLLGASIRVNSQPGKGTTFDIRFNMEKALTK